MRNPQKICSGIADIHYPSSEPLLQVKYRDNISSIQLAISEVVFSLLQSNTVDINFSTGHDHRNKIKSFYLNQINCFNISAARNYSHNSIATSANTKRKVRDLMIRAVSKLNMIGTVAAKIGDCLG